MKTFEDFGIDVSGCSAVEVYTTCPQCSPHRKKKKLPCLSVNTEKGIWNCHHCAWSGSLRQGEHERPTIIKTYRAPKIPPLHRSLDVDRWFLTRGITEEVLDKYGIASDNAYFPQTEEQMPCIAFPYYRGDDLVNVKYRTKEKLFRMSAGAERILYGINDISEELIWVEGEIDKLSLAQAGFHNCVSVPDGAPAVGTKNYSTKFDYLSTCENAIGKVLRHIIAVDNDSPGVCLKQELIRRLGPEKCAVAAFPDGCKDANDVLVKFGRETLRECIKNSQPCPIEGTHVALEYMDDMIDQYNHGAPKGESTGWKNLDGIYSVMPGEWTLVTGIPGHGKSEFIDALTTNLAHNLGWSFGIFSPENHPVSYHIRKLAEKHCGKPFSGKERMTEHDLVMSVEWINAHFIFISPEYPILDAILIAASSLVLRHGIRGLVIDPWNTVEHLQFDNMRETDYISQSITKISRWAKNHSAHVWVLAHPTKLQKGADGNYPVPTPYDVAGSANWRNKADNCIAIYRFPTDESRPVEIHVQKVRKRVNGKPGKADFSYDFVTGRYKEVL